MHTPKVIIIEGLDGCGKSTLGYNLFNLLLNNKYKLGSIDPLTLSDLDIKLVDLFDMNFGTKLHYMDTEIRKIINKDLLSEENYLTNYFVYLNIYKEKRVSSLFSNCDYVILDRSLLTTLVYNTQNNDKLYNNLLDYVKNNKFYTTSSIIYIQETPENCLKNIKERKDNTGVKDYFEDFSDTLEILKYRYEKYNVLFKTLEDVNPNIFYINPSIDLKENREYVEDKMSICITNLFNKIKNSLKVE